MMQMAISTSTLPGIPQWVIGGAASEQAWDLYGRSRTLAWEALVLFALIAFAFQLVGKAASFRESWHEPLGRVVVAAILLAAFPFVMHVVFGTGNYIAQKLFTPPEAQQLAAASHNAAQQMLNQPELPDRPVQPRSWFDRLAGVIKRITPGQRLITELALGVISIGFFIVVGLMAALWRCLIVIIFVVSPLLIAMSVLPGIGKRISGAWFASLVELSFWQVMTAILAALVAHTDNFLDPASRTGDMPAVFFALAYAILYLMLPVIVNWILPIGTVSSVASEAMGTAAGLAAGAATRVAYAVQRPAQQLNRRRGAA